MLRRVLVARLNLDLQHQPQIGQYVAVIGMRGPPRLLGVVADHRSLLMAVERFHRRVDIKNPGVALAVPAAKAKCPLCVRKETITGMRRNGRDGPKAKKFSGVKAAQADRCTMRLRIRGNTAPKLRAPVGG